MSERTRILEMMNPNPWPPRPPWLPPAGEDPVAWRQARGEWVPPPLVAPQKFPLSTTHAIRRTCAFYGVKRSKWNMTKDELINKWGTSHGFDTCLNNELDLEMWAAYDGVTIPGQGWMSMSEGSIGVGKTGTASVLCGKLHLAKKGTGYYGRVDTPEEFRVWGPNRYVADLIGFRRQNPVLPPGVDHIVDDYRHKVDTDDAEIFKVELHEIGAEVTTKGRQVGNNLLFTQVSNTLINPSNLTNLTWHPAGLRARDYCSHVIYTERDRDGRFPSTGYLRMPAPKWFLGGSEEVNHKFGFLVGGAAYDIAIEQKKNEAHRGIFKGEGLSWAEMDLAQALLDYPEQAVHSCFTRESKLTFIGRVLRRRYKYSETAVRNAERIWHAAMRDSGSPAQNWEGTERVVVFEGTPLSYEGYVPGPGEEEQHRNNCQFLADLWYGEITGHNLLDPGEKSEVEVREVASL